MRLSKKYLKISINYLTMILVIAACVWLLPKVLAYFMPFVIAAVIAFCANPLVKFMEKHIKVKRKAGSVIVIILALAIIVGLGYLIISFLVREAIGFMYSVPNVWKNISDSFGSINASVNSAYAKMPSGLQEWMNNAGDSIGKALSDWISALGTSLADSASNAVMNLPRIIIGIIMCVIASYLFVAERENVAGSLSKLFPKRVIDRWNLVMGTMKDAVGGYFIAQFKVEGFVYVILLVGLLILRVNYAVLIALLIAFLDFLPFFGTGAVMWPWALIALVQKNYKLAIGMMVVWVLSQVVRQFIQPKFLGESVGMPLIPTLFLLYLGFRVGGALGLILALPVGMIVLNLYKAGMFSNFAYSTQMLFNDMYKLRHFSKAELDAEGIKEIKSSILPEDDEKTGADGKKDEDGR